MSAISETLPYDERSGRAAAGAVAVVKALTGVVVCALALSVIYGPLDYYCPIAYLNGLLAYGLGWALGRFAGSMMRRFRIHSRGVALLLGLTGAVVGVWGSWLTYLYVASDGNFELVAEAANPGTLLEIMQFLAHDPIWSLGSRGSRSGSSGPAVFYYAVWTAELALVAWYAVTMSVRFVNANKLCGRCNDWVRPTGENARFAIPGDMDVITPLLGGALSLLPALPRLGEEHEETCWVEAQCFACGTCEGENAHVSVKLLAVVLDKNKKPQIKTTELATLAEVTPELEKEIFEPVATAVESGVSVNADGPAPDSFAEEIRDGGPEAEEESGETDS